MSIIYLLHFFQPNKFLKLWNAFAPVLHIVWKLRHTMHVECVWKKEKENNNICCSFLLYACFKIVSGYCKINVLAFEPPLEIYSSRLLTHALNRNFEFLQFKSNSWNWPNHARLDDAITNSNDCWFTCLWTAFQSVCSQLL